QTPSFAPLGRDHGLCVAKGGAAQGGGPAECAGARLHTGTCAGIAAHSPTRAGGLTRAAQSGKLRLALICSQAQTTSASRASSARLPPFMSGWRSLTRVLYCLRISDLVVRSRASRM